MPVNEATEPQVGSRPLRRPYAFSIALTTLVVVWVVTFSELSTQTVPDLTEATDSPDLAVPALSTGAPAAGTRVALSLPGHESSSLRHYLYLPTDWQPDRNRAYPVIVEYPGNGPYESRWGDVSSGWTRDCVLGYGLTAGRGALWLSLPFVAADGEREQQQWWGDAEATVDYALAAIETVCREWGGDRERLLLAGFSRGSIAVNFIGLHDERIAPLWKGFFCYSHYDGVRPWNYEGSDRASALVRLRRLNGRPQFICHEKSVAETQRYLDEVLPDGPFTFVDLPWRNHNAHWVLRPSPQRAQARTWVAEVLGLDFENER